MPKDPSQTAAKHSNQTLPVTSDLLLQTLDAIPTAIYVKNREHRIVYANKACAALFGRSPAGFQAAHESDLFPAALTERWQQQEAPLLRGESAIAPAAESFALCPPLGTHCSLTRRVELAARGEALICFLEARSAIPASALEASATAPWTTTQLHTLLANVPAVIYQLCCRTDGQIQFAFVSPGTDEMFGVSSDSLRTNSEQILAQIHPLDRAEFDRSLAISATTSSAWRWEGRYFKPDGQVGWLQTAARPQTLPSGVVMWDGLLMDITNRKKFEAATLEQAVMEQAIADNETRFRTITATIPGALIQFRVQGSKLSVDFISDRIQDITGLAAAAIMADAEVFLERIHPIDSQRLYNTVKQAMSTAEAWQFEGRIVTPDGKTRWWHLNARPVPPLGEAAVFCGVILDVTGRKQIEDAYRENDRQFRMALHVSGMGVWTWDMATDQMTWTTEPDTLFEETAVSFCDTFAAYLQNVHPSDRPCLQTAVSQALAAGQDYQIEYRLLLGDSTVRWVGERGGLWHDPDGIVLGLMGTVADITHRKTAEAALKESEERNRTLINNIPGAVYRCKADKDWTLLFQSEAIADITGYPVDHSIHQEDWRLIYPHDRERVDAEIAAAIAEHRPFESEYRILHADGSIRWVLETGQPIADQTGTVQLIDGVLTDITRRKESENRLYELARREGLINRISTQIRDSLELTPILQTTTQAVRSQLNTDRVVVYRFRDDWTGQVVVEDVGEEWRSTLGEIGTDNCFPQGLANHYESGRIRAIANIYQAGLDDCHVRYLEELQVKASLIVPILLQKRLWGLLIAHECRGVRLWTSGEIELLTALAGQVGLAIGQADLYRQATENAVRAEEQAANLKATLAELQRTQAKLVQTEKMSSLGQLVAGVAHEINNPVSFIDGNILHAAEYAQDLLKLTQCFQATYPEPPTELAQLIQHIDLDFLASDFPKLLESMRVGAERIKDIVASLRTFSRMDEAEIKAVNIHDGLDSTLMILQHRLKANGDRAEIALLHTYGDLPKIECYAGQLNQVFMNLISNAIDAIEENMAAGHQQQPPTIAITTAHPEPDYVRITIADNGPGITEDKRQHVFEPFYTTKPIGKGTGIGLSISYQIITERHLGALECESQPGAGTAFHITIPVQQGTT